MNGRIYVDLDDVLSETARAFIVLLETHFSKSVAFEAIHSFDLGKSFGLTADELSHFMHLAHTPEVLAALQPIDGAVEALHTYLSLGYEIAIITGRPPSSAPVTRQWLGDHAIPYHSLTFVDKYARGGYPSSHPAVISLDELAALRFCFAIEDSSDMARFIADRMQVPVALLDRPWNRRASVSDARSPALIARCAGWAEIVSRFSC